MGNNLYNNIALRALNQTKTLNPIVYLCIRCFFENFSKKYGDINLLEEYIKRKLYVRKSWSIKENKLLHDGLCCLRVKFVSVFVFVFVFIIYMMLV